MGVIRAQETNTGSVLCKHVCIVCPLVECQLMGKSVVMQYEWAVFSHECTSTTESVRPWGSISKPDIVYRFTFHSTVLWSG